MKYKVNLTVTSGKNGLELDEEYDRLSFPEDQRDPKFRRRLSIEVSKEFAKENKQLFSSSTIAYVIADLSKLLKSDFEDWGTMGYVLSQEQLTESRLKDLL